jgi:hypothetical protein
MNPLLNQPARHPETGYGPLEWPALLRRLDRIDGSCTQ